MLSISRRELLKRAGGLGALAFIPVLARCSGPKDTLPVYDYEGSLGPDDLFAEGVASGDPLIDSIILWTHINPGDMGGGDIEVFVEVSETPDFERRILAGAHMARPDKDYCLKFDATELDPDTTYYYRFFSLGQQSPTGRTKTAPEQAQHLRFGVCSCSNYAFGYFHAYWHLSQRQDIDAVLHLGDYIYEYASGGYGILREYEPAHEITSLTDYRLRYLQHRRDPDLQEAHRQHPWITVWDDHEFANNPFIGGADNHDPEVEGDWSDRVAAAIQAYDEWMPTRVGESRRIYRSFVFGNLVRLHMLDIKYPLISPVDGEELTMLGEEQASWLDGQIADTQATWMILGQQQVFATGRSAWDDHPESRLRIKTAAEAAGVRNVVVLTGDIHQALCSDIAEDPDNDYNPTTGQGSWGVEMVCTSITSPGTTRDLSSQPHKHWADAEFRGYLVLDVTPERVQGDWFGFGDSGKFLYQRPDEIWLKGWVTLEGDNHLTESSTPSEPKTKPPKLAP